MNFVKRHSNIPRLPRNSSNGATSVQLTRITLPYVNNVSEATTRLLAPYGIQVAHRPDRTLRSCVMKPKDPLPVVEKSGVVYKINCNDCLSNYVGETSKKVGTRMHEHKLAIRRGEQYSQILTHMMECGHRFDFDGVRVVANDSSKSGRLLKEAWFSDDMSINRHVELCPAFQTMRAWTLHAHPQHKHSNNRNREHRIGCARSQAGQDPCVGISPKCDPHLHPYRTRRLTSTNDLPLNTPKNAHDSPPDAPNNNFPCNIWHLGKCTEDTPIKVGRSQHFEDCTNCTTCPLSPAAGATITSDSVSNNGPPHDAWRLESHTKYTLTMAKRTPPMEDRAGPLAPDPARPIANFGTVHMDLAVTTSRLEGDGRAPMDCYHARLGRTSLRSARGTDAHGGLTGETPVGLSCATEQGAEKARGVNAAPDRVSERSGECRTQAEVGYTFQGVPPIMGESLPADLLESTAGTNEGGSEGSGKASPCRATERGAGKISGPSMSLDLLGGSGEQHTQAGTMYISQRVPPVTGWDPLINSLGIMMGGNGGENVTYKDHKRCDKVVRSKTLGDGNRHEAPGKAHTNTHAMDDEQRGGAREMHPRACKKRNQLANVTDTLKFKSTRSPHDSRTRGKRELGDLCNTARDQKELRTVSAAGATRAGPVTRSMRRNQTQHL